MDPRISTLYAAATESLVSDASASSTFEKMVEVAYTHSTSETFLKDVKETEKLIKKEFEVTSMPSPWRSAKSVVQSVMKLDLPFINENGKFYGKTHLQNLIKQKRAEDKDPCTHQEYIDKILKLVMNVPEHLDAEQVSKELKAWFKNAD